MIVALVCFNLLVNAAIALWASMALACGACALFRIERGRGRALVLSAPLFKAGYELVRGIPTDAFFWAKLSGATQELGSFRLGFGITQPLVPVIDFSLGALSRGHTYGQSAADLLEGVLRTRVHSVLPAMAGALLLSLALGAVARYMLISWHGARARRALVRSASLLEVRRLGRRSVRIFVSESRQVVPFAAGMFRPWVCLPAAAQRTLEQEEREAVIAHELAHLFHHDLLFLASAHLVAEALSFAPGARWLMRQVRGECEIAADQRAIQTASPLALASALVRVAEQSQQAETLTAELAFLRSGPALHERVDILLAPAAPAPRRPRMRAFARLGLVLVVISTVLRASLLGNP